MGSSEGDFMKTRFSKTRQEQLDQLINDIAEDMNMRRWKRRDFIDCINYLADELYIQRQNWNAHKSKMLIEQADRMLALMK